MRSEHVVEVDPSGSQVKQSLSGGDLYQVRAIEFFIIGTMAAFHAAIVLLTAEGIAAQGAIKRLEETLLQGSDVLRVISAELGAPISLEGDCRGNAIASEPEQDQEQESKAIGAIVAMAVGQETQASTAIAGCPLIPGQMMLAHVLPEGGTQGPFVQDIFYISLDKGEGDLLIPSPMGRIEGLALMALMASDTLAAQDMANGVRGDGDALPLQVQSQAFSSIISGLTGL